MCDTFIYRDNTDLWFGKNSDREPDEPQLVEFYPAHTGVLEQQTTYINVAVPEHRYGVLLSRPSWMWGAEIGVNEAGVVIGNEAVYTKLIDRKNTSLLGMDLVRLALEQASTAQQACSVIIEYLERYGQGGPAGYRDKKFRYDNAFIIADPKSAYVLDTAGRFWARKQVTSMAAISNDLSITTDYDAIAANAESFAREKGWWTEDAPFSFRQTFRTRLMPWLAKSAQRRKCNLNNLQSILNAGQPLSKETFIDALRSHKHENPTTNADVCMHANGFLRPNATTNSWIVKLSEYDPADTNTPNLPQVWCSFGQPCQNEYKLVNWRQAQV